MNEEILKNLNIDIEKNLKYLAELKGIPIIISPHVQEPTLVVPEDIAKQGLNLSIEMFHDKSRI